MAYHRFRPRSNLNIRKSVAPVYFNFMFDWYYKQYLLIGGYGSGKSYHIAFKIICKCLTGRNKVLVVREVYDTIYDSCYDLLCEILEELGMYTDDASEWRKNPNLVLCQKAPLRIKFHNGSTIIFKGMDKPEKIKSINGVNIVWLEECSEIKYSGYKELLGRLRTPKVGLHFILSCNPVGKENWVYRHFFRLEDEQGKEHVIVDEEVLYEKKQLIKNNVYYMHTVPEDNIFLPKEYLDTLEELKLYDSSLYRVAKEGRFGANGIKVLPQLTVAKSPAIFKTSIDALGDENKYFGFDFGFEESYNAVVSMAVDIKHSILYIYDEIYQNHITDDRFAQTEKMQRLRSKLDEMADRGIEKQIIADNEDPKAIEYYRLQGFRIRKCRNKFAGSRLSNTRKIKRFKHIIVSPKCKNVIRELRDLTYKKDRSGNVIYDDFNIDPHTFSAIWYALDSVKLADVKDKKFNSKRG
jgi:phage terminase large subunit|nr:MAG TPA: terminase large subunit [Caudoviricetes sp.]